jgi:hypothetical protein
MDRAPDSWPKGMDGSLTSSRSGCGRRRTSHSWFRSCASASRASAFFPPGDAAASGAA